MAGLPTQGFQLQALPPLPVIPDSVGKIDVKGIYDRVVQGLGTADALRTEGANQATADAQNRLARSTALAQSEVLPSTTDAQIAQNNRSTVLASPEIVAGEANKALTGLDADLVAEQNRRDGQKFLATLTPAQRLVLAQVGPSTTKSSSTVLTPDKNFQSTQTNAATVGGEVVPISTATETSPATPVLTTIPGGPGGSALGTAVTSVGADGKPTTHVSVAPIAALNNIVTGTTYQKVGERRDEQGNAKDVYQAFTTSAAGGQPKPVGGPVEVNAGSAPPGQTASQPNQPFISRDAGKAIEDTSGELQVLQGRKVELENISNAADRFINSGPGGGKFVGPLRGILGDSAAQEFTGSVQNALQTALQPLRGTGRVSNTEFQQALSALPRADDQADTIRSKMQYLNLVTDWGIARQQSILDNLGKGLNRYQALQRAFAETPVPPVPDFYSQQAANPTPATTAQPAAAPTQSPTITSKAQYDALPAGSSYLDAQGKPHVKGGARG